jgi:hypothetical protein
MVRSGISGLGGGRLARATRLGLVLSGLAGAAFAAPAQPILPGYWATTNSASSIVTAPTTKIEKRCISSSQIESFLTGFSNHHYKCKNSQLQYGDGELSMTGACADRNGLKVTVQGKGRYTPESFRINFQIFLAGVPVAKAVSDARRLSAVCPAEPGQTVQKKPAASPQPQNPAPAPAPDARADSPTTPATN